MWVLWCALNDIIMWVTCLILVSKGMESTNKDFNSHRIQFTCKNLAGLPLFNGSSCWFGVASEVNIWFVSLNPFLSFMHLRLFGFIFSFEFVLMIFDIIEKMLCIRPKHDFWRQNECSRISLMRVPYTKKSCDFFLLSLDCRKIGTQHLDNVATNFYRTTPMCAVTVSGDTNCYSNKIEWKTAEQLTVKSHQCSIWAHRLYCISCHSQRRSNESTFFMIFDIL